MNMADWTQYLVRESYRRQGVLATLQLLWHSRMVSTQNAQIRASQRRGDYCTHAHDECSRALTEVGFCILQQKTMHPNIAICLFAGNGNRW